MKVGKQAGKPEMYPVKSHQIRSKTLDKQRRNQSVVDFGLEKTCHATQSHFDLLKTDVQLNVNSVS